jgi:LmbE family N-acetylglucosaminyl deacetylase
LTSSSVKRQVLRGATGFWSGIGYLAGRVGRWKPRIWETHGGQRVLVVAPHPDDEVGCGGMVLLHRRAGDIVHIAHVTDGRRSRAGGLGPDEMAARRREEAAAAATAFGVVGADWLGLREGEWEESSLVPVLHDVLRKTSPQIVYAPSRVDFHPEHLRVARCLARAIASLGSRHLTVRAYQLHVPLTPVLVNGVAPVQAVAGELAAAMRCYRTQLGSIERCWRMKRYGAVLYGLPGLVEEFWEMDGHVYDRLHATVIDEAEAGAFRGVRSRPFTDPLSYLQGIGARRGLRKLSRHP